MFLASESHLVLFCILMLSCWIWDRGLVPTLQGYEDAGDFTVSRRLKTSIHQNLILYAAVGIVGAVGVLILILMNKLHWYDNILILLKENATIIWSCCQRDGHIRCSLQAYLNAFYRDWPYMAVSIPPLRMTITYLVSYNIHIQFIEVGVFE